MYHLFLPMGDQILARISLVWYIEGVKIIAKLRADVVMWSAQAHELSQGALCVFKSPASAKDGAQIFR